MEQLGQWLKSTREAKGITRLTAEQDTKLRLRFLIAIEDGNYAGLPPRVYVRGMIRTYAEYLGLDVARVLELLESELGPEARYDLQQVARPVSRPTILTGRALSILLLLIAGTTLFLFVSQEYARFLEREEFPYYRGLATPGAQVGKVAQAAHAQAIATVTPTEAPTPMPTATPTPLLEITLETKITERSWVRIMADERTLFEGILVAGDTRVWKAKDKILVRSGNAAGVEIVFNGKKQGTMGSRGEVIERLWTRPE